MRSEMNKSDQKEKNIYLTRQYLQNIWDIIFTYIYLNIHLYIHISIYLFFFLSLDRQIDRQKYRNRYIKDIVIDLQIQIPKIWIDRQIDVSSRYRYQLNLYQLMLKHIKFKDRGNKIQVSAGELTCVQPVASDASDRQRRQRSPAIGTAIACDRLLPLL